MPQPLVNTPPGAVLETAGLRLTGSRLIIAIRRDLVVSWGSESGSSWVWGLRSWCLGRPGWCQAAGGGRDPAVGHGEADGEWGAATWVVGLAAYGVGADAFVRGVEDQAKRQLREGAEHGASAGGDGEGGAVAVLGWAVVGRVVPACGELGGGDRFAGGAASAGWAGEDRGGGGVDADIAAEVAEVAPAFGPAHRGEHQRGDDVLQQFPLARVCWVVIFPGGGGRVGLMLGAGGRADRGGLDPALWSAVLEAAEWDPA